MLVAFAYRFFLILFLICNTLTVFTLSDRRMWVYDIENHCLRSAPSID
jgi:hypothetical protein